MEQNKLTYTLAGLTLTLALSVCLFEYKTISATNYNIKSSLVSLEDEEIVEINKPTTPPPPPPPVSIPDVVEVIEDEKVVDKPVIMLDQELDIDIVINVEGEPEPVIEVIFDVVEETPEFIGGINKLYEYLGNKINYPEQAKYFGIQGKVFVQFVVWKDGTIRDVKIVKGAHRLLDKEALRVINNMPNWKPGKQRGKNVNARFTLPIKFRIS